MRYICVQWFHSFPDEPVEIYSESDRDGWETRKIEVFRDGTASYADSTRCTGTSGLAEVAIASVHEINADPQFRARRITRKAFEELWTRVAAKDVESVT